MKRPSVITRSLCAAALLLSTGALAQTSIYDNHEAFKPGFYSYPGTDFRSASGAPGPKYWQNKTNYTINVTLDTLNKTIQGSVKLQYRNNSPDLLPFIWLHLDQNIYSKQSRSEATTHTVPGKRWANLANFDGGYKLGKITITQAGKTYSPDYTISDTRLKLNLAQPLAANGAEVEIKIDYSFVIPEYGTDRMGRKLTKNGWIYEIAQWYPKTAVYDDIRGWDTLPYLGAGEFYLGYGDIDFSITAPAGLIIAGSGELLNPQEVLSPVQLARLKQAAGSDRAVNIRTAEEVEEDLKPTAAKKQLTWHFKIKQARDAAWAASTAFIWDAQRINLPSGKPSLAQAVYPVESKGDTAWSKATEYVKYVIEHYSNKWYEYPYPSATNVAGSVGGMEYPGIVFCNLRSKQAGLFGVTNHEFGHTWFPMIVGSNERRYTFMDEGFNTFINGISSAAYENGKYIRKQDVYQQAPLTFGPTAEPSYTFQDVLQFQRIGTDSYRKPALALSLLRSEVVGEKLFDEAFKSYIHNWAFKHPVPEDFFRTIENGTGEDLGWFWRSWFLNAWKLDQAVTDVRYADDQEGREIIITVENLQKMVMPVTLEIKLANGQSERVKLPAEIWQRGSRWTFRKAVTGKVLSVTLDPDRKYPDIDPSNNVFTL